MAGRKHCGCRGYASGRPPRDRAMSEVMEREVFDLGGFASFAEVVFEFQFVDWLPVDRKDQPVDVPDSPAFCLQLRNQCLEFGRENRYGLRLASLAAAGFQFNDSFIGVNFAPRQMAEIRAGQRCLPSHDNGAPQPARGIFQQRGILFTGEDSVSRRLPFHA